MTVQKNETLVRVPGFVKEHLIPCNSGGNAFGLPPLKGLPTIKKGRGRPPPLYRLNIGVRPTTSQKKNGRLTPASLLKFAHFAIQVLLTLRAASEDRRRAAAAVDWRRGAGEGPAHRTTIQKAASRNFTPFPQSTTIRGDHSYRRQHRGTSRR